MSSLRQRLSRLRREAEVRTIIQSPINVQNLQLIERNSRTGNWTANNSAGDIFNVTKRGINSGQGLDLPSLTVQQGLGRYAN